MKQVWQTDDGSVFDTAVEAEKWEANAMKVKLMAEKIYGEVDGIEYYDDAKAVATWLLAHYNVEPK